MAFLMNLRNGSKRRNLGTLAWVLILAAVFIPRARGGGKPLAEYQVKAAYLLKFAAFIVWPPESYNPASGPLKIGIVGRDPFGPLLPENIPADGPEGISYVTSRLSPEEEVVPGFQILFIANEDSRSEAPFLSRIAGKPVLTVGEGEQFIQQGGMISFTLENNRVRFLVNPKKAREANLKISSLLLSIARIVER